MANIEPPEIATVLGVTVGALITQVGNWLIGYRKRGAEARKIEAEGDRIEAETQAVLADEWRKMLQELRREMQRSDEICKARLADMQAQIDSLREAQEVRDRIIVSLVYRREMDQQARDLMLNIAPNAKPELPQERAKK